MDELIVKTEAVGASAFDAYTKILRKGFICQKKLMKNRI